MLNRFYGVYDIVCHENDPDLYDLQRDFGFLRDDGMMTISPKGTHVNGANIPRFLWPVIGSPMSGLNKIWSANHDSGYGKTLIIIDTNTLERITIQSAFNNWRNIPAIHFVHQASVNRKFVDDTLLQAMVVLEEPFWKRKLVYRAVRLFGRGYWTRGMA